MKKHIAIFFRIIGYYLLYIVLANLGAITILFVLSGWGITELPGITGEFISDVLLLPILIIVFGLYKKEKRLQLFRRKLQWKRIFTLIPISIAARLALVAVISLLAVALIVLLGKDIGDIIDSGIEYQWSAFDQGDPLEKLLGFFSFAVFGPINEELLNRVIILEFLRKHYSIRTSIVYSSVIFMLAHLHPGLYFSSFILGLILAYVYVKWENVWYPIILHMIINVQPFILMYFFK